MSEGKKGGKEHLMRRNEKQKTSVINGATRK